jgi:hypothetical protein
VPASSLTKFYVFVQDKNQGKHNFASDTFKIMLTNTVPNLTDTIKANIGEISSGNGYTAGGVSITTGSATQTTGTFRWIASADPVITASGGSIGPFRYAVVYNDTQTSPVKPLVGYWDYGSSQSLAAGESLTFDLDQTNGIFSDA